jgi:hypothetical protein
MASKSVTDLVRARILSAWDEAERGPLTAPNEGGSVPRDNTPFLTLEFPLSDEQQISFGSPGSNLFREDGGFRIVLSIPAGAGMTPYDAWIEELRTLFRNHVEGGLTTWAPSAPIENGLNENGAYYAVSFAVPFRFDFFA